MINASQPTTEITELVAQYHTWLRDRTLLKSIRQWTEITTPFLDRHNDCIQIYAKKDDGGFLLTDDGYILNDLEMSGCSLASDKRQELLKTTLNGFGVTLVDNALEVVATHDSFALRKHNLIQAMLSINDLFYLASSTVKSIFLEDVRTWLDETGIRYLSHVKMSGMSGFDHVFDFAIPKSRTSPERLLKVIANPNRDNAQSFAFAWMDTEPARPSNAVAYAVINDNDRQVPASVTEAFSAYGIKSVIWSARDTSKAELAA